MEILASFDDRRTNLSRLVGLRVIFIACFVVLAVGFWLLQVVDNSKYVEMAANNERREIPLRAPRGILFDRNGRVLVENRNTFTIAIVREHAPHLDETIRRVADATGEDESRIRDAIQRRRHDPLFRPIPVIEHASFAQVAAVVARKLEMPEVVVQQEPTRAYPADGFAAHLFGYVGEIQESQLAGPDFSNLKAGAVVGQAGIEKTYNDALMGTDGNRVMVVNSVGREIGELQKEEPTDGKRMELTIDYDLQHALEEGFKANNFAGAGVLLDPRNGQVLALTSQPEYDPNDFATGIDRGKWSELNADPKKPLQDRLIQGRYAPGSTFKIVVATAALSEGIITPDFKVDCPGSITLYGHTFHCDKHHGVLDLRHAIEKSCDVYFFKVGSMMSVDTIHKYAEKLGLVGKTGIDLPNEVDSLVPSTEWKLRTTGERWYPGETISVAIGQGQVSVTPIALATMISAIANGGTVVTPHVVKAIDEGQGQGWKPVAEPAPRSVFPINPDVLGVVRDGLWLAVNGSGTATVARVAGHDVMGKTGTAQVVSTEHAKPGARAGLNTKDNSWFVFYAPRDNPEIAGAVFAEHAGFGADSAAPLARYVLETYFAKKEGRPPPTLTVGPNGGMTIKVNGAPPPAATSASAAQTAPSTGGAVSAASAPDAGGASPLAHGGGARR